MSIIREIRRVTMYEYVREYPINTKHIESYVQLGDEIGSFYVVKYESGFIACFDAFSSLPKRARRIVRNSYSFKTEYNGNNEVKIWEV